MCSMAFLHQKKTETLGIPVWKEFQYLLNYELNLVHSPKKDYKLLINISTLKWNKKDTDVENSIQNVCMSKVL